MAYTLLSKPIRRYIYDQGWESLRPIQVATINKVLSTSNHYIIASRTASGKTEAAFLPILSQVNFNEKGVAVLYISPLIALINDQFTRIEDLCSYLDIPVTKWHGEAQISKKKKLVKNPKGVVLITPESLEAMLNNRFYEACHLFKNLKYVVIDEIHSFIGTDRGIHLQSLLARLKIINNSKYRIIGLSATLGNYQTAKEFTGDASSTLVLRDKQQKNVNVKFIYHECSECKLSVKLLTDIYCETRVNKALIFPNSRSRVEEIAVNLKKISLKNNGHQNYFAHHSSIDKRVRESIEFFAKRNIDEPFSITCTSTLELGIDIGSVDKVIQVDSTNSVSSLIQRLGRSGRKEGDISKLTVYSTNQWSLLQSIAIWNLHETGYIDSAITRNYPYDILAYQILSIIKGASGMKTHDLYNNIKANYILNRISREDLTLIIKNLIDKDYLELIDQELIIGMKGEILVNNKNFYSCFQTDYEFKVIHAGSNIGQIPISVQLKEDENIFLAARIWKIKNVDFKSKRIDVTPTNDGKRPIFNGLSVDVKSDIRQQMFNIIFNEITYSFLDKMSCDVLETLRSKFKYFQPTNVTTDRLLLPISNGIKIYTFTSCKINRTICLLLHIKQTEFTLSPHDSCICLNASYSDFIDLKLENISEDEINESLKEYITKKPGILDVVKWCKLLPIKHQVEILKDVFYDIEGTSLFLQHTKFILPSPQQKK